MRDENQSRISSECANARSTLVAAHLGAAQHTAWLVVGRAGSHVPGPLYDQLRRVHALAGRCAVAAYGAALLRHRDAIVWAGCWDCRPDRGDTAARAIVARVAHLLPGLLVLFLVLGEFLVPH